MTDSADFTVDGLTAAYASGTLSPVEATQACLARIEELDPHLWAFVGVDADSALAMAAASERRWRNGEQRSAIDGVPTTIKDFLVMQGWPTVKGSPHLDPTVLSTEDAPAVARLREAGTVILGKTSVPELCWKGSTCGPLGIARNPWNPERTPGGSSGGAAIAAATGMGVLNIGTDGGGSIRMPAAFCGIFGLKPTFAMVPIYPASSLVSHVGPMTRTVRDAAHMMQAIASADSREAFRAPDSPTPWLEGIDDGVAGLRIAYSPDYGRAAVHPEIAAAVESTVQLLADLGAHVDQIDPRLPDSRDAFVALWDVIEARSFQSIPRDQWALSDPGLVASVERGSRLSAVDFLNADAVRHETTLAFNRVLDDYDVLVSPQLPVLAFHADADVADPATQTHWADWTPFTYPLNLSRHPAATVPVGLSSEGLPMAMQIVGRHHDDRLVLRASRAIEQAQPFARLP